MQTRECPPVDLMVRTSGEQRLSDFLLWQSSHALLHWDRCLWPEFGYAHLLRALLAWQSAAAELVQLKEAAEGLTRQLWQQPPQQDNLEKQHHLPAAAAAAAVTSWEVVSSSSWLRGNSFLANLDKQHASKVHRLAAGKP
jgi:hypothetical protein